MLCAEVLEGAILLRRYLKKTKQSIPVFCKAYELDCLGVRRHLSGERVRVSVNFAYKIEHATFGEVPWHSWRSETRRPVRAKDLRKPARKPHRTRVAA